MAQGDSPVSFHQKGLRGNIPATVDEKGRIKIPKDFRDLLLERNGGDEFFVTSVDGNSVRIYPLKEWVKIEQILYTKPREHPAIAKYRAIVNYYGKQAKMDNQGRILIHPLLREEAEINGEVAVLGNITYLEVWNDQIFQKRRKTDLCLTDEDYASLSDFGL